MLQRILRKKIFTHIAIIFTGTAYGYHIITFGLYVDTLLQKADPKHRRVDKIFKEEIGDKFGM